MKKNIRIVLTGVLCASLCSGCNGIASAKTKNQESFTVNSLNFDTVISLQFYANEDTGETLGEHCLEMLNTYEEIFSRTLETSELYAVNHRNEQTVEVSEELAGLIDVGLTYYELSGGRFDFTVAPLSDLWDFKSENHIIPSEESIQEALAKVDASQVSIDGTTLTITNDDVMIDLGALVKGYAADQIKAYLTENGVTSGILNLGGNVLTIGEKPDGSKWRVGIKKPFDETGAISDVAEVTDQSVVTSGIYERYFEKDGRIYHHILDTSTGYPVENDIWGVTIICDSSLTADALSTTCLSLGSEEAIALIESLDGVRAEFILSDYEMKKAD